MFETAKTTQEEVVHAITAGSWPTFPGWHDRRSSTHDERPRPSVPTQPIDPTAAQLGPVPARARRRDGASGTLSGYVRLWWQGVRAGELGTLPIIVGLIVIFRSSSS